MSRRKNYMDDGDDSSDEESGRINFDITEQDLEDEMMGFSGQTRRRGRFNDDSSDEEDDVRPTGYSGLNLGPTFLPAKQTSERSTPEATPIIKEKKKDPVKERVRGRSSTPSPDPGFASFNKYSKGAALKMMEKMGWSMGQGLGAGGEGIVNPIETKLRPKGMGLSFKGFDERTEQAKLESKLRKGEIEDDDGDEEGKRAPKGKRRDAWRASSRDEGTKKKSRKPKMVYKTAADILAEIENDVLPSTQQKVIDMTGPGIREISLSDIKRTDSPTLMEVTTRLPELRHNLRLIVDLARGDLENLSREKQKTTIDLKSLEAEVNKMREQMEKEERRLRKLEQLKEITKRLEATSKDAMATGAFEKGDITALFGEQFDILEKNFMDDIKAMNIDSLVVSVWAPVLKYKSMHWNVLEEPTWGLYDVKKWKKLLLVNDNDTNTTRFRALQKNLVCTPFEMMMNTIWLSKVRSAINNHWNIYDPDPIVQLLEEWQPLLPRFIFENMINQLIIPKLSRAVSDWNPRTDPVMIHTWIHPWFPTLGAWRLAELCTTIRQKLSVVLRQWHPSDESALHIITPWKDIWTAEQCEQFMLKSILPKLTLLLREEFQVNPRDQNLDGLIWCLAWKNLLSDTVMGTLLKNEFFNKWHFVLVQWLSLDIYSINYDQISDWYRWWKQVFIAYGLDTNKMVMQEFRKGLDTMNKALNGEKLV
ncbi:GC-rich sequence DNA-binding factor-like protein-domain-containing protein [Cokeromyces recurvatus]|uniref:GC-rich sequence DNA-binding factor-like protein-domain-containing protein n=1 Tax=Cokeromyces recurvatus TaxID=90255 RepID=UPI002220936E|nr:GC-rich sequence DNA-binding factor-like protein-domain-containing protein [Cokeromyces recurvatus]KAI7902092.1 GC-rich sequence DNA-binding factor-like protein-domain-containing protein [Cokeromyces recurvatus]